MCNTIFNFFDGSKAELLTSFTDYFKLDKEKTESYINSINPDNFNYCQFAEHLKLDLLTPESNAVAFYCKHITTGNEDSIQQIKAKGLLDLKTILQTENEVSIFLKKHNIKVDVDNKILNIAGHRINITSTGENCISCFENKSEICEDCSYCETKSSVDYLGHKLYYYDATLEFFISGSLDRIRSYSTVAHYPEILVTLDKIVSKLKLSKECLGNLVYDWMDSHKDTYLIEFFSRLSDMETFSPIDYRAAYDNVDNILSLNGFSENDYFDKRIAKNVFDNLYLCQIFYSIYFYGSDEKYGVFDFYCGIF